MIKLPVNPRNAGSAPIINNFDRELYCFDYSGRFIRQIGNSGNGPGEYNKIVDFEFNHHNNEIYILSSNKILVFSVDGEFKKSIKISDFNAATIASVDNWIIVHMNNYDGKSPNRFLIYNNISDSIRAIDNPYQFELKGGNLTLSHECMFYKYGNNLHFKELHSDTIFTFSNEAFIPNYLINTGKYKITPEVRTSSEFLFDSSPYIWFTTLFESNNYLFLKYAFENEMILSVLNKKNNQVKKIYIDDYDINLIDNGVKVDPEYLVNNSKVEYFAQFVDSYEIKMHTESELFKTSTPKYPEKKRELEKLANNLSENDNPVLMLVKLKE